MVLDIGSYVPEAEGTFLGTKSRSRSSNSPHTTLTATMNHSRTLPSFQLSSSDSTDQWPKTSSPKGLPFRFVGHFVSSFHEFSSTAPPGAPAAATITTSPLPETRQRPFYYDICSSSPSPECTQPPATAPDVDTSDRWTLVDAGSNQPAVSNRVSLRPQSSGCLPLKIPAIDRRR